MLRFVTRLNQMLFRYHAIHMGHFYITDCNKSSLWDFNYYDFPVLYCTYLFEVGLPQKSGKPWNIIHFMPYRTPHGFLTHLNFLHPLGPSSSSLSKVGWSWHFPPTRDFRLQWLQTLKLYTIMVFSVTYYLELQIAINSWYRFDFLPT